MKKSVFLALIFLSVQSLSAQVLEPKLYANIPVGLNFILAGGGQSQGALPDYLSLGLDDPYLTIKSTPLAYGKTFNVLGHNTKFDLILLSSSLHSVAEQYGSVVTRDVRGMGDTKARLSFNILGAPALSFQEFAAHQPDTIVGVSIQTTIPTGQYDSSKLINIGAHRWAIKPGIGISKTISDYTFEFAADAEFYTSNNDFFGGIKRKQDPVYSTQIHALYSFTKTMWLGIGANYYWGGEYSNDGVGMENDLSNFRIGATLALPINKSNSIKIFGNRGVNTRYSTDFSAIGIAWQYGWAD